MSEKVKSLSLSKLKIAEVELGDGNKERRVTFVASTANEDRDYEHVQIDTFRLPLKGGGHITVSELPSIGADNVDIPFLTNHDLWDVEKTIGSVRRAMFENGKLIFEAGISSRPYAQDVFKLIDEGHLDNAFSIQYRDFQRDTSTNTDIGGEVVEVSLVTRGSNMDAQVLEVKQMKGTNMNDDKSTAPVESTENKAEVEAPTEEQNQAEEATVESAPEVEQPTESNNEPQTEDEDKEKSMHDTPNNKESAAKQVKMPSQVSVSAKSNSDYLKSKQADHDFARTIVDHYGQSSQMVMKAWEKKVKEKGITGDAILPSSLEQIFFKGWEDHYEALGTFRRTTKLNGAVYAFNTEDRALGHRKGDKKAEERVSDVRRDYKSKIMYKKLSIDLQDLIDDETGELLRFRSEELASRRGDELVRAIIFGDGRTKPSGNNPDYRIFDGTRGPWSMVGDLNGSTTSGSFSAAVATQIANVAADSLWQKIVKVRGAIRGGAGRKIIVVPEGTLTALEVATKDNGEPLFPLGTDMQNLFGSYIFESPHMEGSGYDVIGYREGSYLLAAGDTMVRTMFDLDYNTDVMLQEQAVAGTAYGHKVLAGYKSAATAAAAKETKQSKD